MPYPLHKQPPRTVHPRAGVWTRATYLTSTALNYCPLVPPWPMPTGSHVNNSKLRQIQRPFHGPFKMRRGVATGRYKTCIKTPGRHAAAFFPRRGEFPPFTRPNAPPASGVRMRATNCHAEVPPIIRHMPHPWRASTPHLTRKAGPPSTPASGHGSAVFRTRATERFGP